MKVMINGNLFNFVDVFENQIAFLLKDAIKVLDCLQELSVIVLGGDILNFELEHTYDNWYYNINSCISIKENVDTSIIIAKKYLNNYLHKYGGDFYCLFVFNQVGYFQFFKPIKKTEKKAEDGSVS